MDKVYKYGMKLRGFSVGCQPLNGILDAQEDPTGTYYNILLYNRELTADEIKSYELVDLQPKEPNLKIKRKEAGLTQRKLAELAHLNGNRQVEFWESEKGKFNKAALDSALAVAKVLGCSVEELMD